MARDAAGASVIQAGLPNSSVSEAASAAAIPAPRILLPPSPCAPVAAPIAAAPTTQISLQRSRSCSSRNVAAS
jgi:hypothetical protein